MKNLIVLLFVASLANAETYHTMLAVQSFKPIPIRQSDPVWQQSVKIALSNPVRVFGDEVWHFGPARKLAEGGARVFAVENKGSEARADLITGRVLQVLTDGVLLKPDKDYHQDTKTIFIQRPPLLSSLVDGDYLAALAMVRKPYRYTSTTGALLSVEAYDCGDSPSADQVEKANQHVRERVAKHNESIKAAQDARLAAVKAEQDKKTAEARERGAKFRAEREAKEKQEQDKKQP